MKYNILYTTPILKEFDVNIEDIYSYIFNDLDEDEIDDIHEILYQQLDMVLFDLYELDVERCLDFDWRDQLIDELCNFYRKLNEV